MRRRVLVGGTRSDGCVSAATLAAGERAGPAEPAATLGLSPVENKTMDAALQQIIVHAQTVERYALRRRCGHCGVHRPAKDRCPLRLLTPMRGRSEAGGLWISSLIHDKRTATTQAAERPDP